MCTILPQPRSAYPQHGPLQILLDELSPVVEEYQRAPAKQKSGLLSGLNFLDDGQSRAQNKIRMDEARRLVAHVMRWVGVMVDGLGALSGHAGFGLVSPVSSCCLHPYLW